MSPENPLGEEAVATRFLLPRRIPPETDRLSASPWSVRPLPFPEQLQQSEVPGSRLCAVVGANPYFDSSGRSGRQRVAHAVILTHEDPEIDIGLLRVSGVINSGGISVVPAGVEVIADSNVLKTELEQGAQISLLPADTLSWRRRECGWRRLRDGVAARGNWRRRAVRPRDRWRTSGNWPTGQVRHNAVTCGG